MDLLCRETVGGSVSTNSPDEAPENPTAPVRPAAPRERPSRQALPDPAFLQDRVLENLLRAEERHSPLTSYFGTVQNEITPHMRKIVAEWMLEVCDEQQCQQEVFTLAMTYVDRFLSVCRIGKGHLQLLGTACLLLSSKLREPSSRGLPADILVFYTDYSITVPELCRWELLVLLKLKWDMAAVTPQDFLALLIARLPLGGFVETDMVVRHAQTFIALAAKDYNFTMYSASTLAAACVAAALQGLDWGPRADVTLSELIAILHKITGVEQDYLQTCLEQIEQMVQKTIEEGPSGNPNGWTGEGGTAGGGTAADWSHQHDKTHKIPGTAKTPTDVRDVHF